MITDAAIGVINRTGLDGARLRDVARAANVTTGAVTHYFDGKDAVLEATLEEVVRRTLKRMTAATGPGATESPERFIQSVCGYLPLDAESRGEWRVWLAFWGRAISDERLGRVHQGYYRGITHRLITPLRALAPEGRKPSRKRALACADGLIAALDGVGTRATLEPDLWPPDRQKETLTGLLLPLLTAFTNGTDTPPHDQTRQKDDAS